ncbi:MAG: hypothetical protein WA816_09960 [Bacteroidales bacterium]
MKIFQVSTSLMIFIVLVIAGCKKNVTINEKQAILFQVDYVNYASTYQHSGFIIDNQGNVLKYKNPAFWNFPDKDFNLSENQVRDNLKNCLNTGKKIPLEELMKYVRFIKNISSSKVTASKNVSTDAGSIEYICFQFSEKSGVYKGSLIKTEGDFTRENLNFFSKKVTTWLKNINDTLEKK